MRVLHFNGREDAWLDKNCNVGKYDIHHVQSNLYDECNLGTFQKFITLPHLSNFWTQTRTHPAGAVFPILYFTEISYLLSLQLCFGKKRDNEFMR